MKLLLIALIVLASFFAFGFGIDTERGKDGKTGFYGWFAIICVVVFIIILM